MRSECLAIVIIGVVFLSAGSLQAQEYPALPSTLVTPKGTLTNARISSVSGDVVRVFHDGGISTLKASDLPDQVASALGLKAVNKAALPSLPNTLVVGEKTYAGVKLATIEPDGIRITHSGGAAQIRYELLDSATRELLGGFDPAIAEAHRAGLAAAHQKRLDAMAAARAASPQSSDPATANGTGTSPGQAAVTSNPFIKLAAKSVSGGRSTSITWSTTWGSFNKESTSTRIIAVTVSTVARVPQQADVEVLFLWRNQATRDLELTTTGRKTVVVADGRPAVIAGQDQSEDTHDRYTAIGQEKKAGQRYVGWVARALDDAGRVVAVYASTPAYEKYAYAKVE